MNNQSTNSSLSPIGTLLLLLFLLIPFLIRNLAPSLEPYPAVLLPIGIGMVNIDSETVEAQALTVFGESPTGLNWKRINPGDLLQPMPSYYLSSIVKNDFGLIQTSKKEINTLFWGRIQIPRKEITFQDVKNTKKWLKIRLNSLGLDQSKLRITRSIQYVDYRTHEVLDTVTVYDKIYKLNE